MGGVQSKIRGRDLQPDTLPVRKFHAGTHGQGNAAAESGQAHTSISFGKRVVDLLLQEVLAAFCLNEHVTADNAAQEKEEKKKTEGKAFQRPAA